jgi:predicted DNA binding CopG/RHH family protein
MKVLNEEEKAILASVENEEWSSIPGLEEQKKRMADVAKNTYLKNRRINIRISEKILLDLKAKSLEEGVPYQTLISSILHKYTTGRLIEKSKCNPPIIK